VKTKEINSFIILCCLQLMVYGQNYSDDYYQQKVDHRIYVQLDTVAEVIVLKSVVKYTNNSPDDLSSIYFHLWWNGFSDKTSAFSEQRLTMGIRDFYFAPKEHLGGYENVSFLHNGDQLVMAPYHHDGKLHKDIVEVKLEEALKSGQSVELEINARIKIPVLFSRPGHANGLYRMTQWYPKPAVYDKDGWHQMPYLDIGEYFAEYGDYEVTIDVPKDFELVYTGMPSSDNFKDGRRVVTSIAKSIPDFAWFASDRMQHLSDKVSIGENSIDIHLLTSDKENSQKVIEHIKSSLLFYSSEVGLYPYPQYSMLHWADGSGSGMEYPMLSTVDVPYEQQRIDNLIAHEIGHNWFQSAIGTNERAYPWMDEGLNSYIERKYNRAHYPHPNFDASMVPWFRDANDSYSVLQAGVCHLHCGAKLPAINSVGDTYGQNVDVLSYGSNSYERMAMSLQYLENYLGEPVMREGIQTFYKNWINKHPGPSDLQATLEKVSGKQLGWFFQDLIEDNVIHDFKIGAVDRIDSLLYVTVESKYNSPIPFQLSGYNDDGDLIFSQWMEPESDTQRIAIPDLDFESLQVNGETPLLDVRRQNNIKRVDKLIKKGPIKLRGFGVFSDLISRPINWHPSISYNVNDGLMLGLGFYNALVPTRDIRWYLQPNFGLKSGSITGLFGVEKDIYTYQHSAFEKITLGLAGRRYTYNEINLTNREEQFLVYNKLQPSLSLHLRKGITSPAVLSYKLHYISAELPQFNPENIQDPEVTLVHQLNFTSSKLNRLSQVHNLIQLEYESYVNSFEESHNYLKLSASHERNMYYGEHSRIDWRIFGGYFLVNSQRNSANFSDGITRGSFALTQEGHTDHTFEGFFINRSPLGDGEFSDIKIEEGGFKMPIGPAFRFTGSNNFIIASNIKIDFPTKLKIVEPKVFFDLAYFSNKTLLNSPLEGQLLYSAGLALEIGDYLGIYYPLFFSSDYDVPYSGINFFERFTLRLNLRKLNVWRVAEDPYFLRR